jgi:hypothetical protein
MLHTTYWDAEAVTPSLFIICKLVFPGATSGLTWLEVVAGPKDMVEETGPAFLVAMLDSPYTLYTYIKIYII